MCLDSGGSNNDEVGKSLEWKLATKLTKEFNLSQGGRAYDVMDIHSKQWRYTDTLGAKSLDTIDNVKAKI